MFQRLPSEISPVAIDEQGVVEPGVLRLTSAAVDQIDGVAV
jgi:hypothetical protein